MRIVFVFLLLMIGCISEATTWIVSANGEHVFHTIQEAIDVSANSDTVLVYPGHYVENIRFYGKNITLASMEMLTGLQTHITDTILDGGQSGPVVSIRDNESQVNIRGFTITNGSGYYSSTYDITAGGGIFISTMSGQRRVNLTNCHITGNNASWGGGIQGSGNITLSGVVITNNRASTGGGIEYHGYSSDYQIIFDPINRSSIYNNIAAYGCDIRLYCSYHVNVVLDKATVMNPYNYYVSYTPDMGSTYNVSFDVLQAAQQEVNHDLYVAPWGSDTNNGLSPSQPLKTIFTAMQMIAPDSTNPKTIHLAEGLYDSQFGDQIFPLGVKNNTRIRGAGKNKTFLENYNKLRIFFMSDFTDNIEISDLSMSCRDAQIVMIRSSNVRLKNLLLTYSENAKQTPSPAIVETPKLHIYPPESDLWVSEIPSSKDNLYSYQVSGSIYMDNVEFRNLRTEAAYTCFVLQSIYDTKVVMKNCTFDKAGSGYDNHGYPFISIRPYPYGTLSNKLRIEVSNCLVSDNFPAAFSGTMILEGLADTVFVSNCTFVGNYSYGTTLAVVGNSIIQNNVFSNPLASSDIHVTVVEDDPLPSSSLIRYNAFASTPRVSHGTGANMIWGDGNISLDPLFVGSGLHPYSLSEGSGLIDAGYPNQLYMSEDQDVAGNERLWDGNGDGNARVDIGAYEYQAIPAPQSLSASVYEGCVYLSWEMPSSSRSLSGYRLYRNDLAYAVLEGADNLYFQDQISESDTLVYYVKALYGNVESIASNSVSVVVSVVSNSDANLLPQPMLIDAFPNPFSHDLSIGVKGDSSRCRRIEVYNLKGQLVDVLPLLKGTATWKPSNQATGIYFVKLYEDERAVHTKKVFYLK